MRGRRLEKTGGVFAGIRWGFFRAENDADACRSFAAVEWHYSDRLRGPAILTATRALVKEALVRRIFTNRFQPSVSSRPVQTAEFSSLDSASRGWDGAWWSSVLAQRAASEWWGGERPGALLARRAPTI